MAELQLREALREAMVEEMERDESVFLIGEEVAEYDGAYKVSQGMLDKFGPNRVKDTPISDVPCIESRLMHGAPATAALKRWSWPTIQLVMNPPYE